MGIAFNISQLSQPEGSQFVGFKSSNVYTALERTISVKDYGAVGDGITDDSAAFIAARTAAAGKKIHVPAGTYKLNNVLSSSEDLILEGDGDATVLDFTGTISGGNYALEAIGTATQIEELSGTQNVGSSTVLFVSAPTLSVGDVFVIYNPTDSSWSGFRTDYRAGEWCETESIATNTVTLKNPLYDTYVAANVDVYKISGPKVHLANFKIKGTTILGLIKTTFCTDVSIENISATHANDSIIYIDRCFNVNITNPKLKNVGDGGDDYAIAIGNSQHVRTFGGNLYARRHPVTHGGGSGVCTVPVRDSRVIGSLLKNDIASGVSTADFHGNVEDSSFENCTIHGGIGFAGKNNSANNCVITADSGGKCVYHSEVKGGRLGAKNCKFITYVDPDTAGRSIYDIGSNNTAITSLTTEPVTFYANNCEVYGRNLSASTIFSLFANSGTTQKVNFDFDKIAFDVNTLSTILRTQVSSGTAASDFIIVNNITNAPSGTALHVAVGSSYLNFPHRLQRQSGSESISAGTGTSSTLGTLVSYKYTYPRTPHVRAGGLAPFNNNVVANPGLNFVSSTQIRPYVYSADGTNWNATTAVVVNWTAEISEI